MNGHDSSDRKPDTSSKGPVAPVTEMRPATDPPPFPFDEVVLHEGLDRRSMSPEKFLALPLSERIAFILQKKASFSYGGQPVDPKDALSQIRRLRARVH